MIVLRVVNWERVGKRFLGHFIRWSSVVLVKSISFKRSLIGSLGSS